MYVTSYSELKYQDLCPLLHDFTGDKIIMGGEFIIAAVEIIIMKGKDIFGRWPRAELFSKCICAGGYFCRLRIHDCGWKTSVERFGKVVGYT